MFYNLSLISNSTLGGYPITSASNNLSTLSSLNIDPPSPPDFPFHGPTQAVVNFANALFASMNISEFIQAVKDRIRTLSFPSEAELFPAIDKNWFTQPRHIPTQELLAYPVYGSLEALMSEISSSYARIIPVNDFRKFLEQQPLSEDQLNSLFWWLLTKRPRNLDLLINALLFIYPNFNLNTLFNTNSPIQQLILFKHISGLRFLLQQESVNPNLRANESEGTALHLAAEAGYNEAISALLQHPAIDLNIVGGVNQATPLFCAFINQQIKAFELILGDMRADVNIRNFNGEGMLHLFPFLENWESILSLLVMRRDLDFNILNAFNQTPLIVLCQDNTDIALNFRILLRLFQAKDFLYIDENEFRASPINVNAQDIDGNTALHASCKNVSILIFINLIRHPEIRLALKNKEGKIPLEILAENFTGQGYYTGKLNPSIAQFILTYKKINFANKDSENEFLNKITSLFRLDKSIKTLEELETRMRSIIIQSIAQERGNIVHAIINRSKSGKR